MSNTSCLEGKRCPACGQEERLHIEATVMVLVYDHGIEDEFDYEWGDESPCNCPDCGHSGLLRDFEIDNQE